MTSNKIFFHSCIKNLNYTVICLTQKCFFLAVLLPAEMDNSIIYLTAQIHFLLLTLRQNSVHSCIQQPASKYKADTKNFT